jgi:hypothetical protein
VRLNGKLALVTGAASDIGRGIVTTFAREGAQVIVVDRNRTTGEDAAAEINARGGRALFEETDVADAEHVRTLMERTRARVGTLDILVANAGIMICKTLEETSEEEWDRPPRQGRESHVVEARGRKRAIYGERVIEATSPWRGTRLRAQRTHLYERLWKGSPEAGAVTALSYPDRVRWWCR